MRLRTTYIIVSDMERSLRFYRLLLQKEPLYVNEDRWATFDCGNFLSLYNRAYDQRMIAAGRLECFNQAYLEEMIRSCVKPVNHAVVFNFETDDLNRELQRLQDSNIGNVSEPMYVNVHMPYWYFTIQDPDGNVLEITGTYHKPEVCSEE